MSSLPPSLRPATLPFLQPPKSQPLTSTQLQQQIDLMKKRSITIENTPQRTYDHYPDPSVHHDNRVWDQFIPHIRDGDIVVASWGKTGTTWLSQILLQMIHNGEETLHGNGPTGNIHVAVPWLDNMFMMPTSAMIQQLNAIPLNQQRLIKTHGSIEAIHYSPKIRYVYIVRDGRDTALSMFNHHQAFTEQARQMVKVGPAFESFNQFWQQWVKEECRPYWNYWRHVYEWTKYADCENILILNFNELKHDLPSVIRRLSAFLNLPIDSQSDVFKKILEHCSFDYMKCHESWFQPPPHILQPGRFVNQGKSGGWREMLNEHQQQEYLEQVAKVWPKELIEFVNAV